MENLEMMSHLSFWFTTLPQFESGYLYFFSSLAQATATFAGLVAIFAVYRLQIKENVLESFFNRINRWLILHKYVVMQVNREFAILQLQGIKAGDRNIEYADGPREAGVFLQDHQDLCNFHSRIPYYLMKPLKYWVASFFLSLISLLVFEIQMLRLRASVWTVCLLLSWLTYQALIRSGRFIQRCLGGDLKSDAVKI